MDAKFTKGPWKVIERETLEDGSVYPRHIIGGVCDIEICQMEGACSADAYINDPAWRKLANSEMATYNASLIAAAPDMYAALARVASLNENAGEIGDGMLRTIVAEARAAIAKATGSDQ